MFASLKNKASGLLDAAKSAATQAASNLTDDLKNTTTAHLNNALSKLPAPPTPAPPISGGDIEKMYGSFEFSGSGKSKSKSNKSKSKSESKSEGCGCPRGSEGIHEKDHHTDDGVVNNMDNIDSVDSDDSDEENTLGGYQGGRKRRVVKLKSRSKSKGKSRSKSKGKSRSKSKGKSRSKSFNVHVL